MSRAGRILLPGIAVLLAAGCAVGPNYKRPYVVTATAYKEIDGWKPSEPADILSRGRWWRIFDDPVLDDLENEIDISNQNIRAAADAADEARALVREAESSFWPSVSLDAGLAHTVTDGAPSVNIKTLGGSLNWTLDPWGSIRRTVESAQASAQAQAAALAEARLTAHADLATDYFELRAQDQLVRLLSAIVTDDETNLKLTQAQYRAGTGYKANILSAETVLLSAQATQVNAGISRATLEHAIAVLLGKPPATFFLRAAGLASVVPTVPPGVPSTLLERRPDIAEAERTVAAANAQIGVAISAFFPSLTLTGSDTYEGLTLGKLIRASHQIWSLGPTLAETLFEGGLRRAQVAQARASYREDVDNYRQTVLSGFQQVEDELATIRILQRQDKLEQADVKDSIEAESLTVNQYKAGTVPYSSVITAQETRLSAEESALSVQEQRFTASVALIQALGGGWTASDLGK